MMKNIEWKLKNTYSLLAIIVLVFVITGCELTSRAKGKVTDYKCSPTAGFVNGEMDYGVEVKLKIKNIGEEGIIKISSELSTSEGTWKRSQKLTFKAGEEKSLSYFFSEPTVNVTNVQCKIKVFPESN
ncbi:MAG TPA: hypothetical protein PKE69_00070 [Pyrinomonadaceae bacterium]|nr:hypothetical protein [Pyrinomonadaceae bacterium]